MEKNRIAHNDVLTQSLNSFRKDGTMCDVTIIVGEEEFPAHRVVLSAASEYYKTMFNVQMKENVTGRVEMHEMSVATLRCCIEYIYTGSVNIHVDNVHDLLKASSLQQIGDLINLCLDFIQQNLSVKTCMEAFTMARLYANAELGNHVEMFMLENFHLVSKCSDFNKSMDKESLMKILASDKAKVPDEKTMYGILISWIKFDKENREKFLLEFLPHLRLGLLPVDYLFDVVSEEELMKNNTGCMNLVHKAIKQVSTGQSTDKMRFEEPKQEEPRIMIIKKESSSKTTLQPIQSFNPVRVQYETYSQCASKSMVGCAVLDKKLYVINEYREVHSLNLSTNTWSVIGGAVATKTQEFAVSAHEGQIYAAGGQQNTRGWYEEISDVKQFSQSSKTWTNVAAMKHERTGLTMNSVKGSLYAISKYGDVEKYSGNQWTDASAMSDRGLIRVAAVKNDNIFVIGEVGSAVFMKIYHPDEDIWLTANSFTNLPQGISGLCLLNDAFYFTSNDGDGKSSIKKLDFEKKNFIIVSQKFVDWSNICLVTI